MVKLRRLLTCFGYAIVPAAAAPIGPTFLTFKA